MRALPPWPPCELRAVQARWRARYVAAPVLVLALVAAFAPAVSADVAPPAAAHGALARAASSHPGLLLVGKLTKRVSWSSIATNVTWNGETAGNIPSDLRAVYKGETIYKLIGLVDDRNPGSFNVALAKKGYTIRFYGSDGYTWDFTSKSIIGQTKWIVAKLKNGKPLPTGEGPYRDVGSFIHHFYGRPSVKMLVKIKLIF